MATIPADPRLAVGRAAPGRLGVLIKAAREAPLAPLVILGGLGLIALLANLIAPYDPTLPVKGAGLFRPPFWMEGGSVARPLGTDFQSRASRSRLVPGARLCWCCVL